MSPLSGSKPSVATPVNPSSALPHHSMRGWPSLHSVTDILGFRAAAAQCAQAQAGVQSSYPKYVLSGWRRYGRWVSMRGDVQPGVVIWLRTELCQQL